MNLLTILANKYILSVVALAILFVLGKQILDLKKELNQTKTELNLTIESIEANQKLQDSIVEVETTSKVNKQVVIKTQNKLKTVIKKRGVINEKSSNDFVNFSF